MTTIHSGAVAQDAASDPAALADAAPQDAAVRPSGPRLRSCRVSLASQLRRMTALPPWPWRPPPIPPAAMPQLRNDDDDPEAGEPCQLDVNEREPPLPEVTTPPDLAAPDAAQPSPAAAWPDGRSTPPRHDEASACTRSRAADACPEVEAVNRQIEALPTTTSCEQLVRRILAHLEAHAGPSTELVLVGDRSDAATDDSTAALVQSMTILHLMGRRPGPKRLLCESAHHAGRAAAAQHAAARGFEVLAHGHAIAHAMRGALAVAVAGWRQAAAWHQALAHTHATVGVVLVAPLAPGDAAGARWMSHLLSAPGLLKIKPVDDSIGDLSHVRDTEP